jgi:hypothetical protein
MPPKRPLYPGQLPPFPLDVWPNVAELRAGQRVSMATLRRRNLQQFNYEAYRTTFAKRYIP